MHKKDLKQIALPKAFGSLIPILKACKPSNNELYRLLSASTSLNVSESIIEGFLRSMQSLGFACNKDTWNLALRKNKAQRLFDELQSKIPFYKKQNLRTAWNKVPIINSEIMKKHWNRFFSEPFNSKKIDRRKYYVRSTSGSTGKKRLITVLELDKANLRESSLSGVNNYIALDPMLTLSRPANLFKADKYSEKTKWPKSKREGKNHLKITFGPNVTKVDNKVMAKLVQEIKKAKPIHIHGDPNYVFALTMYMQKHDIKFPTIKVIDLGHNYTWPYQKKFIAEAFQIPVYRRYHSSEMGPIAVECENNNFHLLEQTKYIELLNQHGQPAKPGELCQPIITTLDTHLRPLFRYQQGDLLRYKAKKCSCGAPFRIVEFEGRLKDVVQISSKSTIHNSKIAECFEASQTLRYFFQLTIHSKRLQLHVQCDEQEKFPLQKISTHLSKLYKRSSTAKFVSSFTYSIQSKFLNIQNKDPDTAHKSFIADN